MNEKREIDDLSLIDDFLFQEVISDEKDGEEVCRYILSTILGMDIGQIRVAAQKVLTTGMLGDRAIRMDLYAEEVCSISDEDENVTPVNKRKKVGRRADIYDLEIQKEDTGELPRRTRYYQALSDSRALRASIPYKHLGDLWIIVITPMDLFGADRMLYTFENCCIEDTLIRLNDGAKRLFINCSGSICGDENLKELLAYIMDSTAFNVHSEKLRWLHQVVNRVKKKEEVGIRYMKIFEYEYFIQERAMKEGHREGRQEGEAQFAQLTLRMLEDSRNDELSKAAIDTDFRKALYKEYHISLE